MRKKLHKKALIKNLFIGDCLLLLLLILYLVFSFLLPIKNTLYQTIHVCGVSFIILLLCFFIFIQFKYPPIQFDEEKIVITKYKLFRINKVVQQRVFYFKDILTIQFRDNSYYFLPPFDDLGMHIFLKNGEKEWINLRRYIFRLSKRMILHAFEAFKKQELIHQ